MGWIFNLIIFCNKKNTYSTKYEKRGCLNVRHPLQIVHKSVNYLPLTTSLNFLPAENTGTVLAGILISLPVWGFLPFLAALLRGSKVPKPTKVTFLPLETVLETVSIKADNTSLASFWVTFDFLEISAGCAYSTAVF